MPLDRILTHTLKHRWNVRESSGPSAFARGIPGLKSETWGTHLLSRRFSHLPAVLTFGGGSLRALTDLRSDISSSVRATLRNQQQFSRRLPSLQFDMRLPRIGQWIDVLHADLQLPGIHCCQHLFSTRHQLFPRVYVVF
jgi:hypothetical protein